MADPTARVIATYSRRMRLQCVDRQVVDARIKGKKLKPVCADNVVAEPIDGEADWLITAICERRNYLARPNARGKGEVLAANIDTLVVVASVLPKPDWYIVDRYLCAAELMGASAIVVLNKADLGCDDASRETLREYESAGYTTVQTSALQPGGVASLAPYMVSGTTIVVGQSGVGKSSIINNLLDKPKQKTADISEKYKEGKHTTVNSVLLELPNGAEIIDSPGVRDFAPKLASVDDARLGFREIAAAAEQCRFANCRHLREPNCHVKDSVEAGDIAARRYESYRRLVNLTERLNN